MDFLDGSPLRPLLRLLGEAFARHRAELASHEAARRFSRDSRARLAAAGLFHAHDLAHAETEGEGTRAHWNLLSQFYEEVAAELLDLPFCLSLFHHGVLPLELAVPSALGDELLEARAGTAIVLPGAAPFVIREGRLFGSAAFVPNAPHADRFLVPARPAGDRLAQPRFFAVSRSVDTVTEEATELPGFYTGSLGSLSLRGVSLTDTGSLDGKDDPRRLPELAGLLLASVSLGVVRGLERERLPRGKDAPYALFRLRAILQGLVSSLREEATRDQDLSPRLAVTEDFLAAELAPTLEKCVPTPEPRFHPAAKLLRDALALRRFRAPGGKEEAAVPGAKGSGRSAA